MPRSSCARDAQKQFGEGTDLQSFDVASIKGKGAAPVSRWPGGMILPDFFYELLRSLRF
jgi:hypothetical protein